MNKRIKDTQREDDKHSLPLKTRNEGRGADDVGANRRRGRQSGEKTETVTT